MALETETKDNSDNFSAAFDRLAELETSSGETNNKADDEAMADVAPPADEPVAEQPLETPDEQPDEADEEADVEEVPAPAPAQAKDDELLERFAQILRDKEQQAAEAPQQAAQPEQPAAVFSEEESQFLQEYERDWPDVARAEALRRRAEYQDLVGYVFQEVAKEISPILDIVQSLSTRTHLQDLQEVVTDYDDVRDKVVDWVAAQPAYLQPAYNYVIQNGTVDEVADLINRYKEATGVQLQASPASKKEPELPTATKQAAASLAPVSSKRSAVIQADDPGDFDSAFASFADKL